MATKKRETRTQSPKYYEMGRDRTGEYPRRDGWEGPVVRFRLPECPPLAKYKDGDTVYLRICGRVRASRNGDIEIEARRIGVMQAPPHNKKE